jgi:multidrug efflux pump subunit AcrA (membrane-fusion protein)
LAAKSKNLLILAIVAVAVLIVVFTRVGSKHEVPIGRVSQGEFTISLTRSGEILAERSITVSAPSVGEKLLITRLTPEGTFVKKGDLLVQFDPTDLLNRLESAKRDLVAAQAEIELTNAKNELRHRELEEEIRKKEIEARKAEGGSPIDLENARRDLELAEARYDTEHRIMEAEVIKTEIHIRRAQERVASAQKSLEDLSVLAPGAGIVVHEKVWRSGKQVKVQEGDSPWPMQPIIGLPDLGTLYVGTDIDEIDISRIGVGDRCLLTLEAYPDTSYGGSITKVGNLARNKYLSGGPNVFDVSVTLDEIDQRFRPGMKTKVEIIIDVLDDVVFVPIECVFERDGTPMVYVKNGRSFEERQVEVGRRNDTHIVIHSGLTADEEIALEDPTEKDEG